MGDVGVRRGRNENQAPARADLGVGAIAVAEGVEVRASLTRWGGRELAHLRTWFRGRDGRWRPTRRGLTVNPRQLESLLAIVGEMHRLYVSGALGSRMCPGEQTKPGEPQDGSAVS